MSEAKIGVMLVNLGTPDDTRIRSIRRYLSVFLMDRRVIDLPAVLRALLVYGAILPFRPYRTAKAYRKIWQPEGSPLLLHTQALADAVQHALGPSYQVEVGMRYGSPSVAGAADKLASCNQWVVLPLFPQYASAATGSAIEAVMRAVGTLWNTPSLFVKHAFYDDPNFIEALFFFIAKLPWLA